MALLLVSLRPALVTLLSSSSSRATNFIFVVDPSSSSSSSSLLYKNKNKNKNNYNNTTSSSSRCWFRVSRVALSRKMNMEMKMKMKSEESSNNRSSSESEISTTGAGASNPSAVAVGVGAAAAGEVVVQYGALRRDLIDTWPLGSIVTQGCHASVAAIWAHRDHPHTATYLSDSNIDSMHKVTLEVKGEVQLRKLWEKLEGGGIEHKVWIEQPENIPTCLATRPYPKSHLASFFNKLNLCK